MALNTYSRKEEPLATAANGDASAVPEPRSRVEKLLLAAANGENTGLPEPRTREEALLVAVCDAIAGGGGDGGASSADVFIIHATPNETFTSAQLDKTAEQIYEAYQSGKYCLVCVNGAFLQVTSAENRGTRYLMTCSGFRFSASEQVRVVMIEFTTNDGVTWATGLMSPVLYNVSFHGLQISGDGNRMYTISVDANGNLIATLAT